MGGVFMAAIGAAFAFKAPEPNLFTARFTMDAGLCKSVTNNLCDGDASHTVCDNVFAAKQDATHCITATYWTTNP